MQLLAATTAQLIAPTTYLRKVKPAFAQDLVVRPPTCHVVHAAPQAQDQVKLGGKTVKGFVGTSCQLAQGPVILQLLAIVDQALLVDEYVCEHGT